MRRLLIVLLICSACTRSEAPKNEEAVSDNPGVEHRHEAPWITLLAKFKEIEPLGLHIPKEAGDEKGPFAGRGVDSLEASLFPKEMREGYNKTYPGIYACYKFTIDKDRIGLLVRTPGMYASTQIMFFVFHTASHRLTQGPMLAENWGDAGDWFNVESRLLKGDDGGLQALVHTVSGTDNSVEDENDTTTTEAHDYFLLRLPVADTLSKDSALLAGRFKALSKKQ